MLSRMKFEIEPLVAEMLDQLPESVWSSKTSTFFDPAIGGGQFVRAIEQRLRSCGHSDANIRSRVRGLEESDLHIRFAVNKFNLVGQYAQMSYNKFFELDTSMKFDVVVGNPPYQDGNKDGGQNKIYNQFAKKSLDLLTPNGTLAFITPTSVLKESKRFSLVGMDHLKIVDFRASNYFNVGIGICWWLVDKTYSGDVAVYNNHGMTQQCKTNVIYDYSTVDPEFAKLYEALKKATDTPDKRMFAQNNFGPALNKNQTKEHVHCLHKLQDKKIKLTYWSSREPYYNTSNKLSIGMTKSLTDDACYVGKENFDPGYMTIEVKNQKEIDSIKSFIFSEYFVEHCNKWKSLDGYGYNYGLKYLPPFDKTKIWNNQEVKAFIESYVK